MTWAEPRAGWGVSSPRAGLGAGSRRGGAGSLPEPGSSSCAGSGSGLAAACASYAGGARGVLRALVGRVVAQRSTPWPAPAASGQHLQPGRRNLPGGKPMIRATERDPQSGSQSRLALAQVPLLSLLPRQPTLSALLRPPWSPVGPSLCSPGSLGRNALPSWKSRGS